MRVALVLPVYSRSGFGFFGGGERYVYRLARALSQNCHVTLVTFGPRGGEESIDGVRHLVLPAAHRSDINPLPLTPLPFKQRFDLVHAYQLETVVASMLAVWCRISRTPLVTTDLGGGGRNPMRILKLYRWLPRVIAISEHSRRLLPADLQERTVIVKGGVDIARFQFTNRRRRRQVVQVGRIMPHKGMNYLIDAADDDVDVVIAGKVIDKPYYDLLRAKSKGKRVRFVLDPTDETIMDLYRCSAITVAASVYDDINGAHHPQSELLGLTLLESMAVGTPVVCTAVGGMPEYVEDGKTGFIVPPGDAGQMRRRIRDLIDDRTLSSRMSRAGHEAVQKYSWEQVAASVIAEYDKLTRNEAVQN